MIEHPAFPDVISVTPIPLQFMDMYVMRRCKEEGAELAFQSLIKWLEDDCTEHNIAPPRAPHYLKHLKRVHCPECWQSLREAAGTGG